MLAGSRTSRVGSGFPCSPAQVSLLDFHADTSGAKAELHPLSRRYKVYEHAVLVLHRARRGATCHRYSGAYGCVVTIKVRELVQMVDISGCVSRGDTHISHGESVHLHVVGLVLVGE